MPGIKEESIYIIAVSGPIAVHGDAYSRETLSWVASGTIYGTTTIDEPNGGSDNEEKFELFEHCVVSAEFWFEISSNLDDPRQYIHGDGRTVLDRSCSPCDRMFQSTSDNRSGASFGSNKYHFHMF